MSLFKNAFKCDCGKEHIAGIDEYIAEKGAVEKIALYVKKYNGQRAFVLCDENTYKAAGQRVCEVLGKNGIRYSLFVFNDKELKPDDRAVGLAIMNFDPDCDIVIGVGSGVINDIGKIVSNTAGLPYIIVGTAPSMDGYASKTSSMEMNGLKVSVQSKCPNVIIGDIDILKTAPDKMLISGLGDMLAKYVSICEWRIANLIIGEYYCETIADIVRKALKKCTDNADGLLNREDEAIKAVFEGLIMGGAAMNYAGCSRPASGVEHYFSHIWDMRGLEFGTPVELHGIQCAIGTYYAAKIYDYIKTVTPEKEKALSYSAKFDYNAYKAKLKTFIGTGAQAMILLEEKEHKYEAAAHKKRLDIIIENWQLIKQIISEEVPSADEIAAILKKIKAPMSVSEIGMDESVLPDTFFATKDIRDKYVLSRLCWDLGIIDEIALSILQEN